MTGPENYHLLWQQYIICGQEIDQRINDYVTETSLTARALAPFKNRIHSALESLRALKQTTPRFDFRHDGMTLLRAMYDAHLQVLYMLQEPSKADKRAQLFLDYRWIEQRRVQRLLAGSPTRLAQEILKLPGRAEIEARSEVNYQRLRPTYLTIKCNKAKVRDNWYPGNLRDLAKAVDLESEYEIAQKILSGAVHSTPTALLAAPILSDPDHQVYTGWQLEFRVFGRIAVHHGVPLGRKLEGIVRDAMQNLYDHPGG